MNTKSPTSEEKEVLSSLGYCCICTSPSLRVTCTKILGSPLYYCTKRVFKLSVLFSSFSESPPHLEVPRTEGYTNADTRRRTDSIQHVEPITFEHWKVKRRIVATVDRPACKMKWVLCKNRHECNRPLRNWTINCGTLIREFHSFFGIGNIRVATEKHWWADICSIVRDLREDTSCLVNPAITALWRLWYKSLTLFYRLEQWRGGHRPLWIKINLKKVQRILNQYWSNWNMLKTENDFFLSLSLSLW